LPVRFTASMSQPLSRDRHTPLIIQTERILLRLNRCFAENADRRKPGHVSTWLLTVTPLHFYSAECFEAAGIDRPNATLPAVVAALLYALNCQLNQPIA